MIKWFELNTLLEGINKHLDVAQNGIQEQYNNTPIEFTEDVLSESCL